MNIDMLNQKNDDLMKPSQGFELGDEAEIALDKEESDDFTFQLPDNLQKRLESILSASSGDEIDLAAVFKGEASGFIPQGMTEVANSPGVAVIAKDDTPWEDDAPWEDDSDLNGSTDFKDQNLDKSLKLEHKRINIDLGILPTAKCNDVDGVEVDCDLGDSNKNSNTDEQNSDILEELLKGHLEESEQELRSTYVEKEVELTKEVEKFFKLTEEEFQLIPTTKEEELTYPMCFVNRITAMEIELYKREQIFVESAQEGSMNLAVDFDGTLTVLGRVMPGLRTFLLMKRICPTREISIALDENTIKRVDPEDLSVFLLEDLI